jgi:UPF0716 family protein affecting phage T7 exclusion
MNQKHDDPWLVRPDSIRLMWKILWAVLALTVVLEIFIKIKGYFGVDDWIGFGAAFGFFSCVAMVIVAKGLGFVLKRDQGYYRPEDDND